MAHENGLMQNDLAELSLSKQQNETDFVDVTSWIESCATQLSVQDPFVCVKASFNLHDSMAATELTDRKMDCCEIPASVYVESTAIVDEGKVVFPRPVPESLEDTFAPLPWNDLSAREASFIGVQMLVGFQAFLAGSSAGESTFTCLYAHAPVLSDMKARLFGDHSLKEPIKPPRSGTHAQFFLFTCALSVVDLTDAVRSAIVNADIYEEEDFSPNTYDIPLYSDLEEVSTLELLKLAMNTTSEATIEDEKMLEVIQSILGFLFGFLSVCSTLGKLTAESLLSDVESLQQLCRHAEARLQQLESILPSVGFDVDVRLKQVFRQAFDPYVNRPLVGNTPVRKPLISVPTEAIAFLRKVSQEIDWAVCGLLLQGNTLARAQRMLDRIQRSDVNILSRSLIVLNLYFEDKLFGQRSLIDLISEHMVQLRDIPDAIVGHDLTVSFMERLAKPVYDTLKLRTLNRCRQRSYIELVMLHDWIALQGDAHMIDAHFRESAEETTTSPYLSHYVLTYLIRIMDRHLAVGFELELFRSHLDISMAYWYRDFLLSALLNVMSTIRGHKTPVKAPASEDASRTKRTAKGKHGCSESREQLDMFNRQQEDDFEMVLTSAQRDLCRGLKRFLAALCQAGIAASTPYEFTTPERLFQERFAVFALVPRPPPLTYEDYVHGSDFSRLAPTELWSTAAACFQDAKRAIERLIRDVGAKDGNNATVATHASLQEPDLRGLLKVCVGNNVYLLKLRSLVEANKAATEVKLEFAFEGKSQFCTLKLS